MPRKPALDEEEALEYVGACERAVEREGPWRFTLTHVAEELGKKPEELVKTFGARRGLLDLVAKHASDAFARRPKERALDALHRGLSAHAPLCAAMELLEDLRASIEETLDAALADGELAECDPAELARAVEVAFYGTLMMWGEKKRDAKTLDKALRENVDAVLAPFTKTRTGRAEPSRPASRPRGAGRASRGT